MPTIAELKAKLAKGRVAFNPLAGRRPGGRPGGVENSSLPPPPSVRKNLGCYSNPALSRPPLPKNRRRKLLKTDGGVNKYHLEPLIKPVPLDVP
ncbi:hypothetical protein TrVE_jg729 [Triparma verrucosa]|uniref:Uncharacterized protein n=1 Tax=Triparma verrucosa TaxID=1606542 RepID=A0A9W7F7H5_9STRA|nr:hypothetical protein TrVE_jg729 [Triparma verrucosa]